MDSIPVPEKERELTDLEISQLGREPVPLEALYVPQPLSKKPGATLGGREFKT